MEKFGKGVLQWRFSIIESFGLAFSLCSVAVSITLWSVTTFQSKADASVAKIEGEQRVEKIELEIREVRQTLFRIQSQTSFIAGRMGFKNKDESGE